MPGMTEPEWRAFVLAGTRTAKVATVRRDGRPHVTPIWFDLDGPELVFTTWHESVKARSLRRDPRLALVVDDQEPPYSYVIVEGTARFVEDPTELRAWATRIGGRYMGPERAEEYGSRNSVPGELLVRVSIEKVIAERDIAD
ncbi:PPOX class F420-dependent oxidoreductase [Actinocatenispora rupis]|uniref:PPOX class F420-dependent enzyme n=1 Tax=Actinocatenispora rupis TaxID=519421 RepID=A0A8J3JE64_9ACTN|nr:PPOX class F420-dependent oxidoreductase [Actinocatenispora rupis]GID14832.1 PPOX class F420-dependent enzyme [Actinocatenispora rupis]